MNDFIRHSVCPVIAAVIWGLAFSAQSICSAYIGEFSVNAFRGLLAFIILFVICVITKRNPGKARDVIISSLICGFALFAAANFQQLGIAETSAGKSGFITALYIVLVPLCGLLFNRKTGVKVWMAVIVAVIGLYFLCLNEDLTIGKGDLALLACALAFTAQILCIDHFSLKVDSFALSAGMFLVSGALSAVFAVVLEKPSASDFLSCIWPMLYVALFSSCIAYTLQIVAQKGGNPSVVSLLMSLESVFAVLGGAIILHETMTGREWTGCAIMALAIVIAQLPDKKKAV